MRGLLNSSHLNRDCSVADTRPQNSSTMAMLFLVGFSDHPQTEIPLFLFFSLVYPENCLGKHSCHHVRGSRPLSAEPHVFLPLSPGFPQWILQHSCDSKDALQFSCQQESHILPILPGSDLPHPVLGVNRVLSHCSDGHPSLRGHLLSP